MEATAGQAVDDLALGRAIPAAFAKILQEVRRPAFGKCAYDSTDEATKNTTGDKDSPSAPILHEDPLLGLALRLCTIVEAEIKLVCQDLSLSYSLAASRI